MLYIHQLNHLSSKMADLESVSLIRELKGKTPYPLQEGQLNVLFRNFFVSGSELAAVENGLNLIEPTVEQVKSLTQKSSVLTSSQLSSEFSSPLLYEIINLQRAIQMLKSFPPPLQNNLTFLQEFQVWQQSSGQSVALLFNHIPRLKSAEEKIKANEEIKKLFGFLLRHSEFHFNYHDLVNEGQVATASGLQEGMEKGFFFHVTLEETSKKLEYETIRRRIPSEELRVVGEIERNIELIKEAVDISYKANMRIVNLAVILYSYVKWLTGK